MSSDQSKNSEIDEFGGIDDSAFLSIDESAIIKQYTNPSAKVIEKPDRQSNTNEANPKKRSIQNPYASYESSTPFGPNSVFSTGSSVNHNEYQLSSTSQNTKPAKIHKNSAMNFPQFPTSTEPLVILSDEENQQNKRELEKTLQKYYGFNNFLPGQYEIISSLLNSNHPTDCAVFWATGSGKSLCYQVPALHTNKTAIIISPLISLMQDQCDKLNGSTNKKENSNGEEEKIANYLGSAQTDPLAEEKTLQGKYKIVYCTPELLLSNDGYFLDRLYDIQDKLSVIAIDEAHCVSEWGNDFRPDYRRIGQYIQKRPNLKVPLLALTATATPRVRHDIIQSLQMRNPKLSIHSFDRENLQIFVHRKPQYTQALKSFIQEIKKEKSNPTTYRGGSSTIIYVPSKSLVDEITLYLTKQFDEMSNVKVQPYHAGLSMTKRMEHHTNFLIGKTDIIVATIAFGMGIDKPDTRRVFHYGPPKTMEEYYQQIGRAGRDGLPAKCVMWANDSDFSKYASEFYTKYLTKDAKEFVRDSTESLRSYAMDTERCRRATLLKYFSEDPPFGEFCGTCDICLNRKKYSGIDLHRDFRSEGAMVVLLAVQALNEASMSVTEKVMSGKVVENYRYNPGYRPIQVQEAILMAKSKMKTKRPLNYFKEMIAALEQRGYIDQSVKSGGGKYKTSWSAYTISSKGTLALNDSNTAIILPVPPSIREIEAEEEKRRQATLNILKQAGVDLLKIPKKELHDGEGEVIKAHQKWLKHLDSLRNTGQTDRLAQLEDLRNQIEGWRYHTAEKLRMAPASVMQDHLLVKVAYASASSPTPMVAEALEAAGVRTAGLNHLVEILRSWWELTTSSSIDSVSMSKSSTSDAKVYQITFPQGEKDFILTPDKPWEFAVYRPNKNTGLAAWESSYQRFCEGEHPQTIAMNPTNGRPIQVNTVVGHILTSLIHGRSVPLQRLSEVSTPPSRAEWNHLREAELNTNLDVVNNPQVSLTELLRPIMGSDFVEQPRESRTSEDKEKFSKWCRHANWYLALRRVNYEPTFEEKKV